MAGLLLIAEAAAWSPTGGPPAGTVTSMTQTQSVVAAANPTLHAEILRCWKAGVHDGIRRVPHGRRTGSRMVPARPAHALGAVRFASRS